MLDLASKNFKIAIKNGFKDLREKSNIKKEQMVAINRKMKYIKKQNEILDLTISEMRHSWMDLQSTLLNSQEEMTKLEDKQ